MERLQLLKSLFDSIQNTNSKIEKQQIICDNKDNELFTKTLVFLLNPYVQTGISKKKIYKQVSLTTTAIQTWKDMMFYLQNHNTGKDEDIAIVQGFLSLQSNENKSFFIGLITKSLRIGCDIKTVNTAIPNLIPAFNIMLANKYFDKSEKVQDSFTLTEKLDGFRLVTIIHNNEITFYSRQGQLVEGLTDIQSDMKIFCRDNAIYEAFFDGELVALNCEKISSEENYKIVTKTARTKGIKRGLKYMIFDTLDYSEFVKQQCMLPYWKRRWLLDRLHTNGLQYVNILPALYNGSDKSMIIEYLNQARLNHKEGVMVNLNEGLYEFKRSDNLLKVKVMKDADLKIVDIYEGTGKNQGKLGGVVVEFIHENKHYQCECGSGFTEDERCQYWNNPTEIVDKIATIQYFEISKNDNDNYGLRFPVWTHRIRNDKTKISMN